MIRSFRALYVVCAALTLAACPQIGDGHRKTERRTLPDFDRIEADDQLDVEVERADAFEVRVSIDENLLDRVETEVRDGRLHIHVRGMITNTLGGPHVRVKMPILRELVVSGSGDVDARGFEDGDAVHLEVAGAGDLTWQGHASELVARASGAGDLTLDGASAWLDARATGAGDIDARGCTADGARVEVEGAGDVSVTVDGEVDAEVSGAGDLDVFGDARLTRRERSGAGEVRLH